MPYIPHFRVTLSSTPRGARLARLLATEQLRSWGLPPDHGPLVVAELAKNAATHGRAPDRYFRLTMLIFGENLRIELTDSQGDALPRLGEGYGLQLVDALSARWGTTEALGPCKTVWTELTLTTLPTIPPRRFRVIGPLDFLR
ncbi:MULTISPECIES: ATP-binding protein [unclassified Streptomyces]|uniref:ATP-binding protein n=1 Tax=unclassified Streptomyces TaxID=2593676 RepID=UPI0033C1A144